MIENLKGLSYPQVENRINKGLINKSTENLTKSVEDIVKDNVFTLFNILNIVLATIIIIMGDWKNALFIGVAIANTLIGIFQELRFKKTIENLSILTQKKIQVIREGKVQNISPEELVLNDLIVLNSGDQIPADGEIIYTKGIEVDESMLTGEADSINKKIGENLLSGSFLISGKCYMEVKKVGEDNYANKLSMEAKKEKNKESKLMGTLNNIIKILTIIIIPLGLALFYSNYSQDTPFSLSILGATAAILGMIPEGLILLTSITFAVSAINLAKEKTLVQTLPSIETLARADVLCLDKTGTITDGNLNLEKIDPIKPYSKLELENILIQVMDKSEDKNPTALALKEAFKGEANWELDKVFPFSSKRKWSGVSFIEKGNYLIGAPEFLFENLPKDINIKIEDYADKGYRVLALGHTNSEIKNFNLPKDLELLGLLILSDNLRENAKETFSYFNSEGVELKVISGDNPRTVSRVSTLAGIKNADKFIDMSKIDEDVDYKTLTKKYTVFGRVSPTQKRELVKGLQSQSKTVCMTGDGVNDVLALKEADTGVAMSDGSEAARSVADFVLLDQDFSSMIGAMKEGRRVINNIENVSSLYLIKTIYSTILSILFIFLPFAYPFSPLQMGPINSLTVGIPSFFLALEANYKKPEGRFINNVLEISFPAAITVVINILVIQLAGASFNLTHSETATMSVLLTGVVGFYVLIKVSRPLNWKKNAMIALLVAGFLSTFTIFKDFFNFESLFTRNMFFYIPLIFAGRSSFYYLNKFVVFVEDIYYTWKNRNS